MLSYMTKNKKCITVNIRVVIYNIYIVNVVGVIFPLLRYISNQSASTNSPQTQQYFQF